MLERKRISALIIFQYQITDLDLILEPTCRTFEYYLISGFDFEIYISTFFVINI